MADSVEFIDVNFVNLVEDEITEIDLSGMGVIPPEGRTFKYGTTSNVIVKMGHGPFSLPATSSATLKGKVEIVSGT